MAFRRLSATSKEAADHLNNSGVARLTIGQVNTNLRTSMGRLPTTTESNGGAFALNIIGSGESTPSGTNTYSGGTTVGGVSTLNIVSNSAIGTGMLTMAGGSLDNNSSGPIVLAEHLRRPGTAASATSVLAADLGTGPNDADYSVTINVQSNSGTLEIDGNITSGGFALSTTGRGRSCSPGAVAFRSVCQRGLVGRRQHGLDGHVELLGGQSVQPGGTFTVAGGLVTASAAGGGAHAICNGNGSTADMVVSVARSSN